MSCIQTTKLESFHTKPYQYSLSHIFAIPILAKTILATDHNLQTPKKAKRRTEVWEAEASSLHIESSSMMISEEMTLAMMVKVNIPQWQKTWTWNIHRLRTYQKNPSSECYRIPRTFKIQFRYDSHPKLFSPLQTIRHCEDDLVTPTKRLCPSNP